MLLTSISAKTKYKINVDDLLDENKVDKAEKNKQIYDDISQEIALIFQHCLPEIQLKFQDYSNPNKL